MYDEIIEKFFSDLKAAVEMYGEPAVVEAMKDILGEISDTSDASMMESKDNLILEQAPLVALGKQLFKKIVSPGAAKPAGAVSSLARGAIGKEIDQDVFIAGQDKPLEVESDLIKQTNALVQKTNQLLANLSLAIELSNKNLDDLDFSMDDLISNVSGKSVSDIRNSQAANRSTADPKKANQSKLSKDKGAAAA